MYSTDMYEGMLAETTTVQGHNGDSIGAYIAKPHGPRTLPWYGVDSPCARLDEWYREAARRFAHHGYVTISPTCTTGPATATPPRLAPRSGSRVAYPMSKSWETSKAPCGSCGPYLTSTARSASSAPALAEGSPSSPVVVSRDSAPRWSAGVDGWLLPGRTDRQPTCSPHRLHR